MFLIFFIAFWLLILLDVSEMFLLGPFAKFCSKTDIVAKMVLLKSVADLRKIQYTVNFICKSISFLSLSLNVETNYAWHGIIN